MYNGIHKLFKESFLDVKLYHGSSVQKDTIKADSIHFGNKIKDPHWAAYFWRDKEKAKRWAIYRTLYYHLKNNDIRDKIRLQYNPLTNGGLINIDSYYEALNILVNKKCYVYTVSEKFYKVDIGHDKYIDEYTIKHDVIPDEEEIITINETLFKDVFDKATNKEMDEHMGELKSGDIDISRGVLKVFMLDNETKLERMKKVGEKRHTLKPGETDLSKFFIEG